MILIGHESCESNDLSVIVPWLMDKGRFSKEVTTDNIDLYKEAIAHVLQAYGNDPKDAFNGVVNMFRSMRYIAMLPGVNKLNDIYKGKTCVIALTGPSLTKQIPHLKKIWQNTCLIVPDVSLSILESHGIYPHYVLALERGEETTTCLKGKHSTTCIIAPLVPMSFYKNYDGPVMIAYRDLHHFFWLPFQKGILRSRGIVGNMCFDFATYAGFSEIILIGADHAFAEGQTHATGMQFGEDQAPARVKPCKVEGYYGGEVESAYIYKYAREVLEMQVVGHNVYNSTEGGAKIKGTENREFSQYNPTEEFTTVKCEDFTPPQVKWHGYINKTVKALQRIIDTADLASQGKATIHDITIVEMEVFQQLVAHVVQPFVVIFSMDKNGHGVVAAAIRDTTRRIRDELVSCT